MSGRAALVYSPEYLDYRVPAGHPVNPLRLEATFDLLRHADLIAPGQIVAPVRATEQDLRQAHVASYIDLVRRSSQAGVAVDGANLLGLGSEDNPVFPGLHEAASLIVGGTMTAAELVISGKVDHAFNLAGGQHHAQRAKAEGFCVYNDAAVAIAALQTRHQARVAYLDIDAHHGDGVQQIFYDDPDVLTVSWHETGRFLFPGTGEILERGMGDGYGFAVNVPLEPFTEDDSFVQAFESVASPLLRAFGPDIIVTQNGCDGHRLDVMSDLAYTTHGYARAARLVHSLAHELCEGRWVALSGGGYEACLVAPRAWSILWAEMAERPVPDLLPEEWRQRWQAVADRQLSTSFHDRLSDFPALPRRAAITEKNQQTVEAAVAGSFLR